MAVTLDPSSASSARINEGMKRRFITCDDPDRRDLLCSGGAVAMSMLLAGLLGGSRPARAQALAGAVPELDEVAVRIVTDSYQFAVGPKTRKAESLAIEHFGWASVLTVRPAQPWSASSASPCTPPRDAGMRREEPWWTSGSRPRRSTTI